MNVTFSESILYYDCGLLFEAEDEAGRRYIAMHDGDYQTGCEYVVAPATRENLAAFKAGKIGLQSLLLASPPGEWYITKLDADIDQIILTRQSTPIADGVDLTGQDYFVRTAASHDAAPEETTALLPPADAAAPCVSRS